MFPSTETTSKSAPTGPALTSPPIRTSIFCKFGEPGRFQTICGCHHSIFRGRQGSVRLRQLDRLDGQRLYLNPSLPQMGTVSVLQPDNTTTAQAWTQWWARDSVNSAPVPLGFSVAPGDRILSVLTVSDPTTVNCVMVNLTPSTPTAIAVQASAPTVVLRDGTNVQPNIAGATAEWIVERPRVPDPQPGQPPTAYNFADYGRTEFELCLAVEGDSVDISSLSRGLTQELRGARRIRMFDLLVNPARTEFISMPRKQSDTAIRVKYGSF